MKGKRMRKWRQTKDETENKVTERYTIREGERKENEKVETENLRNREGERLYRERGDKEKKKDW